MGYATTIPTNKDVNLIQGAGNQEEKEKRGSKWNKDGGKGWEKKGENMNTFLRDHLAVDLI